MDFFSDPEIWSPSDRLLTTCDKKRMKMWVPDEATFEGKIRDFKTLQVCRGMAPMTIASMFAPLFWTPIVPWDDLHLEIKL